jgi:hypothetical protein
MNVFVSFGKKEDGRAEPIQEILIFGPEMLIWGGSGQMRAALITSWHDHCLYRSWQHKWQWRRCKTS